jgi:hypothetical protein
MNMSESTAKELARPASCFDCEQQSTGCPGNCFLENSQTGLTSTNTHNIQINSNQV